MADDAPAARRSTGDRLILPAVIVVAVLFLCYFVIPGYVLGSLLRLQGVRSENDVEWPRYVFAPSIFVADQVPMLGSWYEAQLCQVFQPSPKK